MQRLRKAEALNERAQGLLARGQQAQAEALFRQAAALGLAAARNNWALCRLRGGDPAGALAVLAPHLEAATPQPFARALAAQAAAALGRADEARAYLDRAIADYEVGLKALGQQAGPAGWAEYITILKHTAGCLGDHRLVLDLHARWPSDAPYDRFLAGVAAFNLGQYATAASHWRDLGNGWEAVASLGTAVAGLAQRNLVPPLTLEYEGLGPDTVQSLVQASPPGELLRGGWARAALLAFAFSQPQDKGGMVLEGLVAHTGQWGIELGRRILQGEGVPPTLQMAAAAGLMEAGALAPGEPVLMRHQGRLVRVTVHRREVVFDDPELRRRCQEALRLRDAGKLDEAEAQLRALLEEAAYVPAMVDLGNILRRKKQFDEARMWLEMAHQAAPDHPVILFNLAGLCLERGDYEGAREYHSRIDPEGLPPGVQPHWREMGRILAGGEPVMMGFQAARELAEALREQEEEKSISLQLTLASALARIPVQWLNAAAAAHGVVGVRQRKQREREVARRLQDLAHLQQVVAALDGEQRAILCHVLDRGGWCRMQDLTRRFGSCYGDGFWWDEEPPRSPLGRLRALGLCYVGRAALGGRRHKVVVVPAELREPLGAVVGAGE